MSCSSCGRTWASRGSSRTMWNVAQRHIVPRSSTLARHLATTAGAHKNVKAPLALSIGASSGTLSALTGVGGGILIIPVLRMATQLTQQQCNGTSLFAVTLSSTAGALSYTLSGLPNFPLAAVFGSVSLLTVSSGVRVANRLNNKRLTQVMAVALACIAPLVAFKPGTEAGTVEQKAEQQGDTSSSSRESTASAPEWVVKGLAATGMPQHWQDRLASDSVEVISRPLLYVGAGLASGFISGLMGVGGGILMTSFLSTTTDIPQARIVATSLVAIVPIGLLGSIQNHRHKNVNFRAGGLIVWVTSRTVADGAVSDSTLRKVFALALLASSGSMWRKAVMTA